MEAEGPRDASEKEEEDSEESRQQDLEDGEKSDISKDPETEKPKEFSTEGKEELEKESTEGTILGDNLSQPDLADGEKFDISKDPETELDTEKPNVSATEGEMEVPENGSSDENKPRKGSDQEDQADVEKFDSSKDYAGEQDAEKILEPSGEEEVKSSAHKEPLGEEVSATPEGQKGVEKAVESAEADTSNVQESKSTPSKKPSGEGEVPPVPEGQTERVEKRVEGAESDSSSTQEDEEQEEDTEKSPEPEKKPEKLERKISETFFYNYEDLCSQPFVTSDSGIPINLLTLIHSFGYDCTKSANLQLLDSQTLLYVAGNQLVLLDLKTKYQSYLRSSSGGGIGIITVHPSKQYFAVGEKGWKPNIIIYEYPSLKPYRILRGGTEEAYAFADFNHYGTLLASVGSSPDYMLTIWDWKQEKIVLRSKAFSQDVYKVTFSPENEEQLTTSGAGHIKFWKMAHTFTGLKLQGALGRFGKTAVTDIVGYVELPDGKVISGSEWGNLLLWEGGLIKVELCRTGHRPCHNGPVNQLVLDEGELVTVGGDGYIRVWDFETIDAADSVDDTGLLEMEHMNELLVGKNVNLSSIMKIHELGQPIWYAQDSNGAIWKLDLSFSNVTHDPECLFTFHSGKIEAMGVSPVTYLMATTALDHSVRIYDFIGNCQLTEIKFKQGGTALTWAPRVVNPKGGLIAVGFEDGVVRIIELYDPRGLAIVAGRTNVGNAEMRLKQAFKPHTAAVTALAYERNGEVIATGSKDKTVFFFAVEDKYEPIGYICVPGPVQALQWSPPSHAESMLLVLCENGFALQVPAPILGEQDTVSTYEIKDLPIQYFHFCSIKSRIKREEEIERREKKKQEEEKARLAWIKKQQDMGLEIEEEPEAEPEKEEPLPPIYIPQEPSPIVCGFYSAPGKFWLSLGGYDSGYLYHCAFSPIQHQISPESRQDEPFEVIPMENTDDNPIQRISFCTSKLLMFCGMKDGAVRVYPLQDKDLSADMMNGYWSFNMHDNDYGQIQAIYSSYDDRFLVTCGADSNIFTFNILSPEDIQRELKAKVPSPRGDLEKEKTAEDIEDPSAYSIENAKRKKEYDQIMKAAEDKKNKKRQELIILRHEFHHLLQRNMELPKHMQLHREEFEMDHRIREEMDRQTAQRIQLVQKELAWDQEKHRIGLQKLQSRFRDTLEFDTVVVRAIGSNHQISTYRLLAISERYYKARKQSQTGKRRTSKLGKEAEQRRESQKETSQAAGVSEEAMEADKLKKRPQLQGAIGRFGGNRLEQIRKNMEKADRAKAKIMQRRKEWDELYKSKPSDNYENPKDVQDIKEAQENMGDFKLKTATNYKIPEHMRMNAEKKKMQLRSLEVAVHEKKLTMNKWIISLRDLKVAIIEEIVCLVQELKSIQSALDASEQLPIPPIPQLHPEETPEKKFQYDNNILLKFKQEQEHKQRLSEQVEDNASFSVFGGKFLHAPSLKEIDSPSRGSSVRSMRIASSVTPMQPKVFEIEKAEPTEMELEILKREKIRNIYLQETLIKRINELVVTFDAELHLLRHQKLKLDTQMKCADLRHITWFEELLLLKNFEKHEDTLQERVNNLSNEVEEMQWKLDNYLSQMEDKKYEIAKLQEREKALYATFQASLGENNKFASFLTKVLKKKIKRIKKKDVEGDRDEEEESDEESDDESSLESDEEDSGSDDEVFDDSVCPKNCDEALFENTLQLREKRLDIEEALVEEKKVIDNLKKEYDALAKKVKVVEASLDTAEGELEAFQREKQQRLNELHVVVPLKLHQVEYVVNGELPTDLSQTLVFTNQSLEYLQQRIMVLQHEKLDQRELYKQARQQHKQLIRDRREIEIRIERLEENCNQLMLMKFGRMVDLEALQTLSVNINLEELKMKMMEKEHIQAQELKNWEEKIFELRQRLMLLMKENTSKLQQLNSFCIEKQRLGMKLDALQNNLGAEFKGPRKAEIQERERLITLVQLQAQEAEVLKEEITILSRKDGRIFPPPQPPPDTKILN
ncbi:cilia- and flagella-associated protein 44 [Trachemys scripta elegans]|uniref:cilia- and flagella-associated protein 44 n=1 Tax=Trachemys scripta elegans TaxID=31138 RepID=UPI001554D6C8|nr:cilia- and flagella-associated protein 44 [Trachemys scripta elegans]